MPFEFSDNQTELRDWIKSFVAENVAPRDKWMDENGFDRELYEKMCGNGLIGLSFPAQYGGGDADTVTRTMVIEEIAKGSASAAFFLGAHWLAAGCILSEGSEQQKAKYMPLAAAGKIFAFGLTEESGGSDAAGIQSVAVRSGEGWLLSGGKLWITNSGVADYYIILAKTAPDKGAHGISAFIVPSDAPGLTVGPFERKMGMRGATTCKLSFESVQLPADALLGVENKGFKLAMRSLDGARITIAALASGIAQHAFSVAKAHALQRRTFGKLLSEHEAIQFTFADMAVKLSACHLLTYDAARMRDRGDAHTLEASKAKLFCTEACSFITNKCLQILGGNGYSQEYDCEQLVRDCRVLEICEGSNEIQRIVIAGNILRQDSAQLY